MSAPASHEGGNGHCSLYIASHNGSVSVLVSHQDGERMRLCSCSPRVFDLVLDLSLDCSTKNVEESCGIDLVFCSLYSARATLPRTI